MIDIVKCKGPCPKHLGFTVFLHSNDIVCCDTENPKKIVQALASTATDIVFNIEMLSPNRARLKDILPPIVCKRAAQKKVAIGFSIHNLLHAQRNQRPQILTNIAAIIKRCRKYRIPMVLASLATSPWEMRHAQDIVARGITLGMRPQEAKAALNFKKKQPPVIVEPINYS